MAGKKLGTIFVELGLDATEFTKGEAKILQQAQSTSLKMEQNFRTLGTHSDQIFNAMKANITNAYDAIANKSTSSAAERLRAEQMMHDKIAALNEQQFGKHTSLLSNLKSHYIAVMAVVGASVAGAMKFWDMAKVGAGYDEQAGVLDNLSAKYDTTADAIVEAMDRASGYQVAKSELMKVALEGIAKGLAPKQLLDLADAAQILGDVTGKGTTVALQDLARGLETGRVKTLDQLGVTIDLEAAFGELAGKMTKTEKTQALYNLVMIETIKLQDQQKKAVDTGADSIAQVEKKFDDATLAASRFAKTVIVGIIEGFKALAASGNTVTIIDEFGIATEHAAEAINKEVDAVKKTIAPYEEQNKKLKESLQAKTDNVKATKDLEAAEKKRIEYISAQEAAWMIFSAKENEEYWIGIGKDYDEDQKKWIASLKYKEEQEQKWIEFSEKEHDEYWKVIAEDEEKARKTAADNLKARGDYEREIYKDLRGYENQYYEASEKLIEEQAKKYREAGVDEVAVAAWVKQETLKNDIAKGKSGDKFVDGINAGYEEMERNAMKFGKAGFEIFDTFQKSSTTAISDGLFQAIKTGTVDIQTIWETFADAMLKKFTDILAQMIVEGATKQIMLYFGTNWVNTGSAVINFISSVLGMGSSSGAGYAVAPTGATGYGGTAGGYAYGGFVPGFASGGDSPANDKIHAMLSPGEYVVPRSIVNAVASQGRGGDTMLAHINPAEAALLKSIGGSGTVNPLTGLPEFGLFSKIANIATGGAYGAITGDYGGTKGLWTYLNPGAVSLRDAYLAAQYGKWGDIFDSLFDPVTGPGIDNLTRQTGKTVNDLIPWMGQLMDVIAPLIGGLVGGIYGGPGGAAGGAAAGSGVASKWNQKTNEEALKKAAITAAVTYVTSAAGSYASSAASGAGAGATTSAIAGKAVAYATKYIMGQLMGAAFPPEQGQVQFSYEGANDNGLLGSLSALMNQIAPQESNVSFPLVSARSGLDYIPRDRFPIIAHEGEAVLNKKDAQDWRGGSTRAGVTVNFNFPKALIVDKAAVNDLALMIYPQLKKLEAYGH